MLLYTLWRTLSFGRDSKYIFVRQCVWWLASIIGLQHGLVIHIDNRKVRVNSEKQEASRTPRDLQHDLRINNKANNTCDKETLLQMLPELNNIQYVDD
jgi:hypothetical protein